MGHYVLDFLRDAKAKAADSEFEYRLACSGEFYNKRVVTFDWRKSDVTRLLLERPLSLLVVSQPFQSYPQELAARFRVGRVTESAGSASLTFVPDAEIAEGLCAILSLLSRRLVSVVAKTRERCADAPKWYEGEIPAPIIDHPRIINWARRPATVITQVDGQEVKFNDLPPTGVDDLALGAFLRRLPDTNNAEDVIYAARLYKSALELIEERPDTAYLALVSVIETLAAIAFEDLEPEESWLLERQRRLQKRAIEFGLCEAQALELVTLACEGEKWIKRKFVKFCMTYCPFAELEQPDRVFFVPEFGVPRKASTRRRLVVSIPRAQKISMRPHPSPEERVLAQAPGSISGTYPSIRWESLRFHLRPGLSELFRLLPDGFCFRKAPRSLSMPRLSPGSRTNGPSLPGLTRQSIPLTFESARWKRHGCPDQVRA